PPEKWLAFTEENLKDVPQAEGVFHLLDEDKKAIFIAGREDIKAGLEEQLKTNEKAKYFAYEEDKMFTKRESELLQQHLQKHGKLPEMNDELDDLF
ncbi:MAG: BzdV protein, partial [Thermoplasmata archaeon]|nr:BzdV protein [Thermoplasmata archaeon]